MTAQPLPAPTVDDAIPRVPSSTVATARGSAPLRRQQQLRLLGGLLLALLSACAFGTSGALAKGLLQAGWSPAAAVTWRVGIGAVALLLPAILMMRGRWDRLRTGWPSMVLFGLLGVVGCQLAYFFAVERLSVAVALLIEYCGVLLVVGWLWLRHGQRPRPLTIIGTALALLGLMLVLDVFGAIEIDIIGALWATAAAVGLAGYFVITADDSHDLPALVVATGGMIVAAVVLLLLGASGLVSMAWTVTSVSLAGATVPWWVAVAALGLVAAALSYAAGVTANRRLGSKVASFVGLSEVMFAVLWAWLLLSELPALIQLLGGALILAGVVVVRLDEASPAEA